MDFETRFDAQLSELREKRRFRELNLSTGISFVHNDYLGLSKHPRLLDAARTAVDVYGAGSTGSRLLGGHHALFEEAEADLATFFRAPAALLFSTGYLANLALLQVVSPYADFVLSDELNHASLIDGIRLSKASCEIYPHRNVDVLEGLCGSRAPLVVSESLFSMDGNVAPLKALIGFVENKKGFLIIDEAHAAGIFPEDGRGLLSLESFDWSRTAVTVTFGKAFGCSGAAVLCSPSLRELLINQARAFIYTTAGNPASVGALRAALPLVQEESWRREELWSRAEEVRRILSEIPHAVSPPAGKWEKRAPIIPLFVQSEMRAMSFAQNMRDLGIELRAIRYPTVKVGTERIRISLSLNVSADNTFEMARLLVKSWTEFL